MSDLIASLRELASYYRWLDDAADELERLTKENEGKDAVWLRVVKDMRDEAVELQRENDELRKAFDERVRVIEMQLKDKEALQAELAALKAQNQAMRGEGE